VGKALRQFVTVRYEQDHTNAKAVLKQFNVHAFPTLLVLGPDGEEWAEIGPLDPPGLVEDLARIRTGEDTLPSLRGAVEKDPADVAAATKLASALSNRYPAEAVALCRATRERVGPGDARTTARLLFLEGYAESNRNGSEAALALFERVLTDHPGTEEARDACVFAGNVLPDVPVERGLAFIAKVLPQADAAARADLEYTRGFLYLKAAEAAWLERGEEAGDEPEVLNSVAWECFQRGWHTEKAIGWARRAVKLSDRAPHILDTLANLLFRSGAVDEAIRLEEEAMAKAGDPDMRAEFEENLVTWNAVKVVRAGRAGSKAK